MNRTDVIVLAVSIPVTILAVLAAAASSGAGHGDYFLAKALFPAPMLLTLLTGDTITALSMTLALVQFPLYALLVVLARRKRRLVPVVAVVVLVHVGLAVAAFPALPNFA